MAHPIRLAARELEGVLKSVADINPAFMAAPDKAAALVELTAIEARVAELRLRVTADAGDVADESGARDAGAWAAVATHRRRGDCAAELRLALALEDRPVLAGALRDGRANLDQSHVIAAALANLPREVSAEVVDQAEAAEARRLADLEASARRRMRLRLRALGDGTTRISGLIPDEHAARLATYLHAFTNPRRDDAASPSPEAAQAPREPYGRRAAQAFCQLLETLDPTRLPIHGGDATTLMVTMSLASLRAELATATLGNPAPGDSHDRITAEEARRLACTAQIVPAVLGGKGEVLDLGRSQRLFTRRALALATASVAPRAATARRRGARLIMLALPGQKEVGPTSPTGCSSVRIITIELTTCGSLPIGWPTGESGSIGGRRSVQEVLAKLRTRRTSVCDRRPVA